MHIRIEDDGDRYNVCGPCVERDGKTPIMVSGLLWMNDSFLGEGDLFLGPVLTFTFKLKEGEGLQVIEFNTVEYEVVIDGES
jgi:hypothetical protein